MRALIADGQMLMERLIRFTQTNTEGEQKIAQVNPLEDSLLARTVCMLLPLVLLALFDLRFLDPRDHFLTHPQSTPVQHLLDRLEHHPCLSCVTQIPLSQLSWFYTPFLPRLLHPYTAISLRFVRPCISLLCLKCACYPIDICILFYLRGMAGSRGRKTTLEVLCKHYTHDVLFVLPTSTPTSDRAIDRTKERTTMLLHSFDAKVESAIFSSMPASICSQGELKGGRTPCISRPMSRRGAPLPAADNLVGLLARRVNRALGKLLFPECTKPTS